MQKVCKPYKEYIWNFKTFKNNTITQIILSIESLVCSFLNREDLYLKIKSINHFSQECYYEYNYVIDKICVRFKKTMRKYLMK